MGNNRNIRSKYAAAHGLVFKTPVGEWRHADVCDVVGCEVATKPKRRLCGKHRTQVERKYPMKKGKGWITESGYRRFENKGKTKLEHVRIWEAVNGPIASGLIVHHKDENRLNNTLDNLQVMTRSQHMKLHWQLKRGIPCVA